MNIPPAPFLSLQDTYQVVPPPDVLNGPSAQPRTSPADGPQFTKALCPQLDATGMEHFEPRTREISVLGSFYSDGRGPQ